MNLDDTQRKRVAEWIAQGMTISEIQNRLAADLGLSLTYMDVRLLVDDLKLTPKDIERAKPADTALPSPAKGAPGAAGNRQPSAQAPERGVHAASPPGEPTADPKPARVSISVDQIARPGAVVSGKVNFSDGNSADWYFDQTGRLGLIPQQPGYRPAPADLQQFQMALDAELSRLGF
jgi:hypothetical protein